MSSFVYSWDKIASKWLFEGIRDDAESAKEFGRDLWRRGVAGIKIVDEVIIVEQKR